jgi:hypothetical protein
MQAVLGRYGFRFCFNFLPSENQNFEDVLLANRLPAGWLELYVKQQFGACRPLHSLLQADGSSLQMV